MSQINPFVNVIVQGMQAQRTVHTDKASQQRRAQTLKKNLADEDDVLEHQVETADDSDEDGSGQGGKQNPRRDGKGKGTAKGEKDDSQPHLDLTA